MPVHLPRVSIDLSEVKNLKGVRIRLNENHVTWIAEVLQTMTSKNRGFKQIEIGLPWSLGDQSKWETFAQEQCEHLDYLLAYLWEDGIHTGFVGSSTTRELDASFIKVVFPQLSKKLETRVV